MVGNIFSQTPLSIALEEGRARRAALMPERGVIPEQNQQQAPSFDGISSQFQVPVNILMSLAESNGLEGDEALSYANTEAQRLAPRLKAGQSVTEAVNAEYGTVAPPGSLNAMFERAKAIAAELYPSPNPTTVDPDAGTEENPDGTALGRALNRGVLRLRSTIPMALAEGRAEALGDASKTDAQLRAEIIQMRKRPAKPQLTFISASSSTA